MKAFIGWDFLWKFFLQAAEYESEGLIFRFACGILSFAEDQYTTHSEAHIAEHSRRYAHSLCRETCLSEIRKVRCDPATTAITVMLTLGESECLSFCDVQKLSSGDLEKAVFLVLYIAVLFHLEE